MIQCVARILKRLLDNRLYWSVIEGPLYNTLIYRSLDEGYGKLLNTLSLPLRAKILDIGSGAGQATIKLAGRYPATFIYGIDYAVGQVQIARLLQRKSRVSNISFRVADVTHIPFRDGAFDAIVSLGSIKHWSEVKQGIAEMYRVLKPGGQAHIIECDAGASREEIAAFAARASQFLPLQRAIAWYQERVVFGQSIARDQLSVMAHEAGFGDLRCARMEHIPLFHLCMRK